MRRSKGEETEGGKGWTSGKKCGHNEKGENPEKRKQNAAEGREEAKSQQEVPSSQFCCGPKSALK